MENQDKTREEPKPAPRRDGESRPQNQRIDHEDPVEEASDESFPASDPPAY